MEHFIHFIWRRFKDTPRGRLIAGLLAGVLLGLSASLAVSHEARMVILCTCLSGLIGGIAVLLLESRDRRRSDSLEWKERVEQTAQEIQRRRPQVGSGKAKEWATAREQQRFSPLVWIGMAFGAFCVLCGIVMFVVKIVNLFRV